MYTLLAIVFAICFISVLGLAVMMRLDRRWYRRHPGAEEMFARVDEELSQLEGR